MDGRSARQVPPGHRLEPATARCSVTWAIHRGGHFLSSVGWRVNPEGATRYDTEAEAEQALADLKAQSLRGLRDAEVLKVR